MTSDNTTKEAVREVADSPVRSARANAEPQGQQRPQKKLVWALGAVALCLAGIVFLGIRSRVVAESRLKSATTQAATPVVQVIYPQPGAPTQEIVLGINHLNNGSGSL